jgi:hypothetical protein
VTTTQGTALTTAVTYKMVRAAVAQLFAKTGRRTHTVDAILTHMGLTPRSYWRAVKAETQAFADYGDGGSSTDLDGNPIVTFTGSVVLSEGRVGIIVYMGRSATSLGDGALADLSIEWVS